MVKILVMDDEPALRNIVYNIVKPLGHPIFTAEDGKQAVEIGRREVPNLALLDMRVPDMDGLEVLAELKKINPNILCIMLSGFGDVQTAVDAIKKGAFDYISKPFKVDEVLRTVNKALTTMQQQGIVVSPPPGASAPAAPRPAPVPAAQKEPALHQAPAPGTASSAAVDVEPPPPPEEKKGFPVGIAVGVAVVILAVAGVVVMKMTSANDTGPEAAVAVAESGSRAVSDPSGVSDAAAAAQSAQGTAAPAVPCGAGGEYAIAYSNPSGMAWIKGNLWVGEAATGNIYQHAIDEKLTTASIYKTSNAKPSGLAFDGKNVWSCSPGEGRIYKHAMDNALTVEAIYATQGTTPHGLFCEGAYLWVIDRDGAKIYKHRIDESLSLVGTYPSPAAAPCGMFAHGDSFYIGDYRTSKLYKLSKDLTVKEVFAIPYFGKYKMAGMTFDGESIWASVDGIGRIVKFSMNSLKPTRF